MMRCIAHLHRLLQAPVLQSIRLSFPMAVHFGLLKVSSSILTCQFRQMGLRPEWLKLLQHQISALVLQPAENRFLTAELPAGWSTSAPACGEPLPDSTVTSEVQVGCWQF